MAFKIMLILKAAALIRNGLGRRQVWLWLPVKAALWVLMVMVAWGGFPATFVSPGPVSLQAAELAEPREGSGTIDYIEGDRIVIDDCAYNLSELVVFYKNFTLQQQIPRTRFKVGKNVGYTIHTDGKIIEIWLE